jgi:Cu2+-exporting ATPase
MIGNRPPIEARLAGGRQPVCCIGCKAVAEFIEASGFAAYYDHRELPHDLPRPEGANFARYDADDMLGRYVHRDGDSAETTLEIGGLYCSACVWLLERSLQQRAGIHSVDVSSATGRAVIAWDISVLPFSELLASVERIGFRPEPVGAGYAHDAQERDYRQALKRLIVAAAAGMQVMMFAVALYAGERFGIEGGIEKFLRTISLLVTLPIVFYSARPFFAAAWRGIRARSPGMDLPVSLAIAAAFAASVWAVWTDGGEVYFDSVAMFVLFLSGTRFLEMRARHRADDHRLALARLLPDTATRLRQGKEDQGKEETVAVDLLKIGDLILIRPGDVIPADGEIVDGRLTLDESLLSGESLPVARESGMQVCAGASNQGGSASVRVLRTGASTSLAGIGRLLERARADRPPLAVLADRIASRFVLAVLSIAVLTGGVWMTIDPSRVLGIVLATLVVTCPCALALATPAALAAATSRLAANGFFLVRSRILDVLQKGATIVFDKTGTLTRGEPRVLRMRKWSGSGDDDYLLALAAAIETASDHVLARAFAPHRGDAEFELAGLQAEVGRGVEASLHGIRYRIGSREYVAEIAGAAATTERGDDDGGTLVCLGSEHGHLAEFVIGDALRADAAQAIDRLREAGFDTVIASGDRAAAVQSVAATLGIRDWHAAMTPADKLQLVATLKRAGHSVVMVGDGINDAPVLAAADASIALDAGTALARASADAIAMSRRLMSVVDAARIAARTRRIVRQNIAWAIAYNLTAVPLAASGLLAPWMAALGMSLSSLLVVLNALRLHRFDPDAVLPSPATAIVRLPEAVLP